MEFFEHQESARSRSRSLLWRFVLANLLLAALLSAVLLFVGEAADEAESGRRTGQNRASSGEMLPVILCLDLFMLLTVSTAAVVKFYSLSSSGGAVAEALGGTLVSPETTDPLERRYRNVVDEMAIAANCPVPEIYILEDEEGINAFASGPSPEKSAVAVTRGALQRLSRDELQGVVAHEFSHIVHGDVRLNIRLAAYISGLVVLSTIGYFMLRLLANGRESRRSSKDKGGGAIIVLAIGLFFLLFGFLGKLVSVLMSAAISREREYLADATAVQLTRNPEGIAGALKKIGGFSKGASIDNASASGLSHFFLAEGKSVGFFEHMYASHPPLLERIKRLEPQFSGELPDDDSIGVQTGEEEMLVSQLSGGQKASAPRLEPPELPPLHAEWLPEKSLHAAIVGVGSAEAVVCSLLLPTAEKERQRELEALSAWIPAQEVLRYEADAKGLSVNQQVSAVFMALPTIQLGSKARKEAFRRAVEQLSRADGSVSLLEFLLSVLVYFGTQDTDPSFTMRGASSRRGLKSVDKAVVRVLSVCALFASQDESARRELFGAAASSLKLNGSFLPDADSDIGSFMSALDEIRAVSPRARKALMNALHGLVLSDGKVTELELALMRVFAVLLRTGVPPLDGLDERRVAVGA